MSGPATHELVRAHRVTSRRIAMAHPIDEDTHVAVRANAQALEIIFDREDGQGLIVRLPTDDAIELLRHVTWIMREAQG